MHKVVVHKAGGFGRLRIEKHPDPVPGPHEVCVQTRACGVNFADTAVRMGLYESARKYVGWPITPGFEFAGRVARVGVEVDDLEVGAEVLGVTLFGGYASHVVVPRHQLFIRPAGLSPLEAASFPCSFLTAWYALADLARPRAGSTVLVHSAAGGVGGALVKIARTLDCRVVGVVGSSHKVETALSFGADMVVDAATESVWDRLSHLSPQGYDVVLDANGASILRHSYEQVARGGRLVVYGFHSMLVKGRGRPNWPKLAVDWARTPRFDPMRLCAENRSVMGFNLSYMFDQVQRLTEAMDELLGWLSRGLITPAPVKPYPFEKVAQAHEDLSSGSTVGKLVLVTDPGQGPVPK